MPSQPPQAPKPTNRQPIMLVKCACPTCREQVEYDLNDSGTVVNCPNCNSPLQLPPITPTKAPRPSRPFANFLIRVIKSLASCPTALRPSRPFANPNLRPCKDCGNQVSKNADSCPHCGAKIRRTSFLALLAAGIGAVCLIAFIASLIPDSSDSRQTSHKLLNATISATAIDLRVQNHDTFDWHDTQIYLNGQPGFTYHYTLDTLKAGESVSIPLISFDNDGKRFQPLEYKVTKVWIGGGGFDYHSYGYE